MTEPNTSRREATKARLVSAGIIILKQARGDDAQNVVRCAQNGFES